MKTEPLVTVASITAAVTAFLALLAAFGLPLSDTQQTAVLGVVAVTAPLVVALLTRPRVTPTPVGGARKLGDVGETGASELAIVLIVLGVGLVVLDVFMVTSVGLTVLGVCLVVGGIVLALLRR